MSQLPFESDTFEVVCRLGLLTGDGADGDTAPRRCYFGWYSFGYRYSQRLSTQDFDLY